jgi:preprotein translocase subunit SecE
MAQEKQLTEKPEAADKPVKKKAEKPSDKKPAVSVQTTLTDKTAQLKEFFQESKVELKKITWPTRKETIATGIAVLVLTFVMALFLGVADLGLTKIVELILS